MINRNEYLNKLFELKDIQIIKVVTGIRRCGKSTILKMFQEKLLGLKVDKSHIIEMNFENPENLKIGDWENLYNIINEQIIDNNKYYIFLDEIQNINEFEKAVDGLYIKDNVDIYITGSNAYTLSSDFATILTGRYIEIKMLPLSFKEYISAYPEESNENKLYLNYTKYGSFPQTIEFAKINKDLIKNYLDDVYNSILFKDVITKNKIYDATLLEKVTKFLYDNIGNISSTKKNI